MLLTLTVSVMLMLFFYLLAWKERKISLLRWLKDQNLDIWFVFYIFCAYTLTLINIVFVILLLSSYL